MGRSGSAGSQVEGIGSAKALRQECLADLRKSNSCPVTRARLARGRVMKCGERGSWGWVFCGLVGSKKFGFYFKYGRKFTGGFWVENEHNHTFVWMGSFCPLVTRICRGEGWKREDQLDLCRSLGNKCWWPLLGGERGNGIRLALWTLWGEGYSVYNG